MLSQSRKRPFGVLGIHHSQSDKRNKRQVQSLSVGRHAPVFPQSIIAQQVMMTMPPLCAIPDADESDLMAPRGDNFSAMIPMRGEWAVKIDVNNQEDFSSAPLGVARVGDIQIYTCGNGVWKKENITFMGIVTNAQALMDENRDNIGALDIGGTVTGINYGPERLCAGDMCYIGLPYMIDQVSNGVVTRVPGVACAGMPASKAHFGTYRMKWNNVVSAMNDIDTFIQEQHKLNPTQDFVSSGNMHTLFQLGRSVRDDTPLFDYAGIKAMEYHCVDLMVSKANPARQVIAINAFIAHLVQHEVKANKEVELFDRSQGITDKNHDFHEQHAIHLFKALVPTTSSGDCAIALIQLMVFSGDYKLTAIAMQHNFMQQRMMGRVLVNSDPGAQLDVVLGFFN